MMKQAEAQISRVTPASQPPFGEGDLDRQRRELLRLTAKRILPSFLQTMIRVLLATISGLRIYSVDFWRFLNASGVTKRWEESRLRARITADYHVIEKGLSHHAARIGFGKDVVIELTALLQEYCEAGYSTSCSQYRSAVTVLECYREFHRSVSSPVLKGVDDLLRNVHLDGSLKVGGGSHTELGHELVRAWRGDFHSLANHRHSIRHFSGAPVSRTALLDAVDLARTAPSACNRQPAKVHVVPDQQRIRAILELHGGARGFAELVDTLLIITVDLRGYFAFTERNLGYVDGGLFAMNLIYALCYQGIGSCPLHLALGPERERKLRYIAGLPGTEALIVMLALGNIPETFKVANSQRKPLCEYVPSTSTELDKAKAYAPEKIGQSASC